MRHNPFRSCLFLFSAAFFAFGGMAPTHSQILDLSFTDIWAEDPAPQGSSWGVNFAQSDNFIFATFFVYGEDGQPKWYTGEMNTRNGTSRCLSWETLTPATAFCGALHQTVSKPPSNMLSPSETQTTPVGKVAFEPLTPTTGRLYIEIGSTQLTKNVRRLTLTAPPRGAEGYYNSSGKITKTWKDENATVTVTTDMADWLTFLLAEDGEMTLLFGWFCQISGRVFADGPFYVAKDAVYLCWNDGPWGGPPGLQLNTTADIYFRFNKTGGMEGYWVSKKDEAHNMYEDKASFSGTFQTMPE
ncbi:MAG: hypothetical protein LBE32_02360 [Burkholderiales bacterium]|jgi:hypothetical protein|nr:hypothetical protein [Burkholderiales bacterium]